MEIQLPNVLKKMVDDWRKDGYISDFPALSEIFNFNKSIIDHGGSGLRYLRKAQFEALETYWFLRLILKTPRVITLYKILFGSDQKDFDEDKKLLRSLGIPINEEVFSLYSAGGISKIFNEIENNNDFITQYKLSSVRETLSLQYPSYIFALAMGAGKTVLIGSIIATEMILAIEYPKSKFVENALVFAPGKTIFGALREITQIPYEKILPPRLFKEFITKVRFTYTKDDEKDIPIIKGSLYNVIVTNTEKIRIQKGTITKNLLDYFIKDEKRIEEAKSEIANLRLQTVASLPNLAIFSDEAHHTYGNALDKELKRVRQTVNFLARNTSVITVINTTGTPFFKKQVLRDVVYWYSLSQGISDGILKEVRGNIIGFENVSDEHFIKTVIIDFFENYKDVQIFNGSYSKIAIYFPKIDDIREFRSLIEKTLLEIGLDPSIVLEVHNKSSDDMKDLFDNRINDPNLTYRVFLLVNKGTEGWNCLSLYATALARELKSSNNFCLQAASRCLREIPNNTMKAKIYLSEQNVKILDTQLRDTYNEKLSLINITIQNVVTKLVQINKLILPQISIIIPNRCITARKSGIRLSGLQLPKDIENSHRMITYNITNSLEENKILEVIAEKDLEDSISKIDIYSLTNELSSNYHLPLNDVFNSLEKIYPLKLVPINHVDDIRKQIEDQIKDYEVKEIKKKKILNIIKKEGFDRIKINGSIQYAMEMSCKKERAHDLILDKEELDEINKKHYGFHYSPYFFDSKPEKDFFVQIVKEFNLKDYKVKDIYFTGGIIDPNKTDFYFEYTDENGKLRLYFPDFVILLENGRIIIVEVKMERLRTESVDGEQGLKAKALHRIAELNEHITYIMLFTNSSNIGFKNIEKIKLELLN